MLLFVPELVAVLTLSWTAWHIMSLSQNDAGDIIYFVLCFLLTFAVVFIVIFILFLCFSGRICVMIYYLVQRVQVITGSQPGPSPHPPQAVDPETAPLILETDYFPRPAGYDGYCMVGQESVLPGPSPRTTLLTQTIRIGDSSSLSGKISYLLISSYECFFFRKPPVSEV